MATIVLAHLSLHTSNKIQQTLLLYEYIPMCIVLYIQHIYTYNVCMLDVCKHENVCIDQMQEDQRWS